MRFKRFKECNMSKSCKKDSWKKRKLREAREVTKR